MDATSMVLSILGLALHWSSIAMTSDLQHYCYTELITALAISCDRIYAADSSTTSRGRRSPETVGAEDIRRRLPRNVVEQCCRRPCNVATLQRYCSIIRENRRLSIAANSNGTTRTTTPAPGIGTTRRGRGQRSTTPVADGRSTLQSLTESPSPDPVPVGDFNFYP